ncbi:hypothetical protein K461DRAFT_298126 [Myriangium duriaei CBS 260.36]|uniref:Uncharacterized protein n=1 Tax=Myriangium duriaei CBS 260.36 TaxID=1168546 RepID=A0A9P4IQV5_9PEZI|nr:hypothetical protein K461DRAFT_298126 [Myriangium duriaei CBS 260.36]
MGTRYLLLLYHRTQWAVAQYGQFDGSPSTADRHLTCFCSLPGEFVRREFEWGHCASDGHANDRAPLPLSMDGGLDAGVLPLLATAKEPVPVCRRFEKLFDVGCCEWFYLVDLDEGTFEVSYPIYHGDPGPQNSHFLELAEAWGEQCPVRLAAYRLVELPSKEDFMLEVEKRRGEELNKALDEFIHWGEAGGAERRHDSVEP